ncbi:hypothetical protein VTI74DRAFT_2345 [Chaetomium olivicolor]
MCRHQSLLRQVQMWTVFRVGVEDAAQLLNHLATLLHAVGIEQHTCLLLGSLALRRAENPYATTRRPPCSDKAIWGVRHGPMSAFLIPGYFTVEPNGTAELDPGQTWQFPADTGCSGVVGETPSADSTVTLSANFALQSDFPTDYLSSYSSWAGTWYIAIYSQPNCTGGGTVWTDCSAGYLTQPLSWAIRGGLCTAYDTTDCKNDDYDPAYTWYEGCHSYDASQFDTKTWLSVRCGADRPPANDELKVATVEMVVAEDPSPRPERAVYQRHALPR